MTAPGEAAEAIDVDALLFAELDYLRLKPFGSPKLGERLERTPNLSRLAAQLYGPAETLPARDQHQRALLRGAAGQMDGSAGEALLAFLGLTRETSGRSRSLRLDIAGPLIHPHPLAGSSLGRAQYWRPFLEQAVAVIRRAGAATSGRGDEPARPLRDLTLPIVERGLIDALVYELRSPFDATVRAHVVCGPPESGRFTTCDEALARVTAQNRHVVRVDDTSAYHRDLLAVLGTYSVRASSWSLAACEREFQLLMERNLEAFGGVILRGATSVDQVQHLLPRRPGSTVLVTARHTAHAPPAGIDELDAEPLGDAEAVALLRSGHAGAEPSQLQQLATLLYGHAGLLAAAARSRLTVAALIRRLRRNRLDQVLDLALNAGIDLEGDARRLIDALGDDHDTVLALDLRLWVAGFGYWDLLHSLGYWLGRDASPARITRAQTRLYRTGIADERDQGLTRDLVARHRARRMTPLLHQLARLDVPDAPRQGIHIVGGSTAGSPLWADAAEDSPEVTLLEFLPNNGRGYGAIFTDASGAEHAQLWRYAPDDPGAYVLYEDGQPHGDHRLLDPDKDSAWPHLTRHMIAALTGGELPELRGRGRCLTVGFSEGPVHRDPEIWDAPAIDLTELSEEPAADEAATETSTWRRDESTDEEAGELFA